MIGSSTYVGMIIVGRAEQPEKAESDMVTREVDRDRLVRASLTRRESYKRRIRRRSQQPFQLQIYYNLTHHNLTQLALVLSQRTNTQNEIIHKLNHTTNPHTTNQYVCACHNITNIHTTLKP